MPSFLVPQNSEIYDQWVEDAALVRQIVRIRAGSPWQGLVPDLDPSRAPASGMAITTFGLVARPGPSSVGEVLMPDAGFTQIPGTGTGLPLDSGTGTAALQTNISMLAMFHRTDSAGGRGADASNAEYDNTTLALVGGDESTDGSMELWRRLPSDGEWEQITFESSSGSPDSTKNPAGGREYLSDWAEFPAGCPGRTAWTGAITAPVFVWCNLLDDVMVYPNANEHSGSFEPLTDRFSTNFKAKTVEHFGGRLYFGNTLEGSTRHRQRIRRTALFTADPLETSPGAGAFDIRDFSGDLLRLEKLGDLLVAYFQDGTAFIRLSGIATAPDAVQLLREQRGLLSTFAVTSVGNQEHFGIFDDGWFFLDPSGRWTEVGMLNIDGVQTPKWKETFYDLLDYDNRDRMVINYDGKFIRISFPTVDDILAGIDNQEVWIFDPRGNRIFRDRYPVSVWAHLDDAVKASVAWENLTGSWEDLGGSWSSFAARFGLKQLNHGTIEGHVFVHNYGIVTKFDIVSGTDKNPTFRLDGVLSAGGDPTTLKKGLKLWMEYIHTGGGTVTMTFSGDGRDGSEGGSVDIGTRGSVGEDIDIAFRTFNFTAANIRYSITGNAPIQIRSVLADLSISSSEERFT